MEKIAYILIGVFCTLLLVNINKPDIGRYVPIQTGIHKLSILDTSNGKIYIPKTTYSKDGGIAWEDEIIKFQTKEDIMEEIKFMKLLNEEEKKDSLK